MRALKRGKAEAENRRTGESENNRNKFLSFAPTHRLADSPIPMRLCVLFALSFIIFNLPSAYAQEQAQQQPKQQGSIEDERLSIIKADIQKEVEHNEELKKEIEEAQKNIDEKTKERLLKVSKMYEAMPPEEAAKRLEKLDENTAVDILSMLKPRAAGGILAQMDSDKAASISKKIITKGKQ